MAHPYFDKGDYAFRDEGQHLYEQLCQHVHRIDLIRELFQIAWQSMTRFPEGRADAEATWREVLRITAGARHLQRLCDAILAKQDFKQVHDAVQALIEALDPVAAMIGSMELPGDKLFLDRTSLRSTLGTLNPDKPVLVIRGGRGSGKSWTRELIKASFAAQDAIVEVNAQLNYSFRDLIVRLIKKLEPNAEVKDSLTTESASHKEIIFELLARAESGGRWGEHRRLWIIVDDLNDVDETDPLKPRLSQCGPIRSFMEAFVVEMMSATDFGQYFRLVLIDYPARDLQRWPDVWVEDKPDADDFDADLIADALVERLKRRAKFLEKTEADKRSQEILAEAAAVPPPERLRAISTKFRAQAQTLSG